MSDMNTTPEWIASQRIARHECITCGAPITGQIQCDYCWTQIHGEHTPGGTQ